MRLIQVYSDHFIAGIQAQDGHITTAAPIVGYMVGWDGQRFKDYCEMRGWTWKVLGDFGE